MTMFSRREPTRKAGAPVPPEFASFKARRRWQREHGIRPVGPQTPPEPETTLGVVEAGMAGSIPHLDEYQETVRAELIAIDRRRETIAQLLAADAADSGSPKHEELRVESTQLLMLRREVERDLGGYPLAKNDAQREYVRSRAESLREQLWRNAEKLAASGEHLHARKRRIDAMRARHLSEHEIGLRPNLSGY